MNAIFPDWKKWFEAHAKDAAKDDYDYQLHLAATHWMLSSALDINRREDFVSLPLPNVDPFAHQVEDAILFFRRLQPRGMIADDVGLGKTITAGLVARELLERGRIDSILVVCPKSLVEQWQEELESKFSINAQLAVGINFRQLDRAPFWITSYHTARSRMPEIRARKFDLLILDESHALRNLYGTQQPPKVAQVFQELMRQDDIRYCLMLTATPIQNRLWDIFSLLEILKAPQPNPFGTPDQFRNQFIADQAARSLISSKKEEFRNCVSQATVRTRRRDTNLLFPDREVKDQLLTPLPAEKEFIARALEMLLQFPPLVQITHARTLMSSPRAAAASFEKKAAEDNIAPQLRIELLQLAKLGKEIKDSAKAQAVVKLVKASAINGKAGRIIVFTQRLETLRFLTDALQTAGFGSQIAIMQGGEAGANRRAIHDFMADPPVRPILLSSDTGAVGLNLQAGNIVVNYDLPWNPMVIEQRIGRIQRLGQKSKKVIVYNLVLSGTIEERVVLRLMEKLNLFNQAIGEMEELLELCGYDEEKRSLDQVIMDLIRKAAEQKDIEEDLRRMKESRDEAEKRMRDMREANEQIFQSIKPRDTGARLEGLERISPQIPLSDLIKACLQRGKVDYREEDGRLFVRISPLEHIEFLFERQQNGVLQDVSYRVVIPGTRAFENITKSVRERIAHNLLDTTNVGIDRISRAIEDVLKPLGMVCDDVEISGTDVEVAGRFDLKASVEVASDRYETILEANYIPAGDGIEKYLNSDLKQSDGTAFPKSSEKQITKLADTASKIEGEIEQLISRNESINKFRQFYEEHYKEDLERLAEHVRARPNLGYDRYANQSSEAIVNAAAQRDPSVRSALDSIKLRWTPRLKIEPLGVAGINYARAKIKARIRNRNQDESFPVQITGVPLSGMLLEAIPGIDRIPESMEAWCCPGGHVTPADCFSHCSADGCTKGACDDCLGRGLRGIPALHTCKDCSDLLCGEHRLTCAGCGETICSKHALLLSTGHSYSCSDCAVTLSDGHKELGKDTLVSVVSGRRGLSGDLWRSPISGKPAFPEEMVTCEETGRQVLPDEVTRCEISGKRVAVDVVEASAVSGRRGIRSRMKHSDWSGKPCFPGEEQYCEETGILLLPDEIGVCAQTRKAVHKNLLETDIETGEPVLKRLLGKSNVTGKSTLEQKLVQSEISDRKGIGSELIKCEICGKHILVDEGKRCPETGMVGCPDHFVSCDYSGEHVLPDGISQCEVTGKRVKRSLLMQCPETGKRAISNIFQKCEQSGDLVLPEGLGLCSVTGKKVKKSLLVACKVSGQLALPQNLVACGVSGKLVRPDLLIACPETGLRILPDFAATCEETGKLVSPDAIVRCSKTGRLVMRSTTSKDDYSGSLVLKRLLVQSAVSNRKTLAGNLVRSAVSGKMALPDEMIKCEESGRPALPGELERCSQTDKMVYPDLLMTCPDTGKRLLVRSAARCEASGELVSPSSLARCEETNKQVRISLLEVDQVSGKTVQSKLLRVCERTGTRTLNENLSRSAASGKLFLSDLTVKCEETGALALPEELVRCEITGKRVLPELLAQCEVSGRRVLRSLLRKCDVTGKLVLPELMIRCKRSGKTMLSSSAFKSEVSGDQGHPDLIVSCEISGKKAFPDELIASQISGKKVAKDRTVHCPACHRIADISEMKRCSVCNQQYCPTDISGEVCMLCAKLLIKKSGRDLSPSEIAVLQRKRPWVRKGREVESPSLLHIELKGNKFSLTRNPEMIVLKKRPGESSSIALDSLASECTVNRRLISSIKKVLALSEAISERDSTIRK